MTHHHTQNDLLSSLSALFGTMDESHLQLILARAKVMQYEAGEYVFQQGETGHALYVVLSGRFRALENTGNGIYILGDISAGQPIGEFSLFTKEPHSASIVALRKSSALCISEKVYLELVGEFPSFANSLTRFVIHRMRRNSLQRKMDAAPKNIAVVNLNAGNDVSYYTTAIEQQLQAMGLSINIYDQLAHQQNNGTSVFDTMEKNTGLNFLVCDAEHIEWARECIAYCDLVIVVADFNSSCSVYEIEHLLHLYKDNVMNKKIYLLFLHPENAPMPVNTRRWFDNRVFNLHLHIRKGNAADIRRFCRIVTHQATGLVLGGGGARGFAHVGVLKALTEAGLEFDFVGGTSAGGIYGAAMTHSDFNMEKIMQLCQAAAQRKITSNDLTLPLVSLMSGKKMRKFLKEMFGDSHLEDFWISTFCVSTNFSTASIKIHEDGLARQQVEASIAIPGVFPPVLINQHLHIDGGIIDNLPVEPMHKKPVRNIIAVSLSAEEALAFDMKELPSPWKLFWNKFTKTRKTGLPGLSSILINSITLNSRHRQDTIKPDVALYIELDLKEFNFLGWNKWQQILDKGYEQTRKHVSDMPAETRFWR